MDEKSAEEATPLIAFVLIIGMYVCMRIFFFAADSIVLLVSKAYKYERGNAKERQKVDLRFSAHNFLGFVNTHTHSRNMIKTADTRMVSCKKPRNC